MRVEQVHTLLNQVMSTITGEEGILNEDLTNVVDVGRKLGIGDNIPFDQKIYDNYVRTLVNHIGKVIFDDKVYRGRIPSVVMDSWEYGSILEKIRGEMPKAVINSVWDLQKGESYDPYEYHPPTVSAKFFNNKVTFMIIVSFNQETVKESFSNAAQLNGFFSMIRTQIENAMNIEIDSLVMRTINSFTGDTIFEAFGGAATSEDTGIRAVNLLKLYKDEKDPTSTLTPKQALGDAEFLRFASMQMQLYMDYLTMPTRLYNMGRKVSFTYKENLHFITLSRFIMSARNNLYSDTFNSEYVELPKSESVPFWQGPGRELTEAEQAAAEEEIANSFELSSKIDIVTGSGNTIAMDGILAVMFDKNALGVLNPRRTADVAYTPKGRFFNNFYTADGSYFNDHDENFVVFFVK